MAARNRSAGSRCGSGRCWAISTISWVRGAPRMGAVAAVSHSDKLAGTMAEPGRIVQSPEPDASIDEQHQSRSASISFSSMTGDTISPTMSIVLFCAEATGLALGS